MMMHKRGISLLVCAALLAGCGTETKKNTAEAAETAEPSAAVSGYTPDSLYSDKASSDVLLYTVEGDLDHQSRDETPFGIHGKLHLGKAEGYSAPTILDENGEPFALHGVSTHGLQWYPEYVNADAFQSLRDEWGINCVRLACYVKEGGYLEGAGENMDRKISEGIKAAEKLGMYVILDWHVLNFNPNETIDEAEEFFGTYAEKYADCDNVIYEICNEPVNTPWYDGTGNDLYTYCDAVCSVIREAGSDSLILCGTNTWSQDILDVKNQMIDDDSVMYTLHFYAGTHYEDLRSRMVQALDEGIPVFVSEFGICDASGNGNIDTDNADAWVTEMVNDNVSFVCWSLCNKDESASCLKSSCAKLSRWEGDELSETGIWLVNTCRSIEDWENGTSTALEAVPEETENTGGLRSEVTVKSTWNGGAEISVNVINDTDTAVHGWQVSFVTDGTINNLWCGEASSDGDTYTVKNLDWNALISSGESVNFGFILENSSDNTLKNIQVTEGE